MRLISSPTLERPCRRAFSLVELLCVIAIVGALVGIILPAVQNARESARIMACKNKMRQLALAALGYEENRSHLPPGTLGFAGPVVINSGEYDSILSNGNHRFAFKKQQNTSWLVQVLPYVEQRALFDKLPPICADTRRDWQSFRDSHAGAPDWLDGYREVREVSASRVELFLCPSDAYDEVPLSTRRSTEPETRPATIGAQLVYLSDVEQDRLLSYEVARFNLSPAPTNYVGCTGAASVEAVPAGASEAARRMVQYRGAFRSRIGVRIHQIRDGTANTIMIGEAIGFIDNGVRSGRQSWFFNGLARGHSALEWERPYSLAMPGLELIGDSFFAYPVGFGSMHPASANFANADGSVISIGRGIDWQTFYYRCGINDRGVVSAGE